MRSGHLVIVVEGHLYFLLIEAVAVKVLIGRRVLQSSLVLILRRSRLACEVWKAVEGRSSMRAINTAQTHLHFTIVSSLTMTAVHSSEIAERNS
jgi:hypothetical protein